MKKPPLELHNLTKNYGKYRGIDAISIELKAGEVFGFLGPNGAGKSTTIRTILDFIHPSSGRATMFGLDSHKDAVQIKNRVGYLAGDIELYDNMTGRQILKFLTRLGKKTDWEYVEVLQKRLDASLDRKMHTLSKGNKQKIGLIQAFMHKPDLLILDEPTSGLDPLMKQVFYDMVLEMKGAGKTIFVSSHDLTEVQKICDRAAFIREGTLIDIENIKEKTGTLQFKRFTATFPKRPLAKDYASIKGVTEAVTDGLLLHVTIHGDVAPFITELAKHTPTNLEEQDTTLEDIFMHYYNKETQ